MRVAIIGTGQPGRRMWEALMGCGTVDVVAFVEAGPRSRVRRLLGLDVQPLGWLAGHDWQAVALADSDRPAVLSALRALGVDEARTATLPVSGTDDELLAAAAVRFPDPLAPVLCSTAARGARRVGIFGTGAAGINVWEALTDIDDAEAVWFADNDIRQQGRVLLWLDVIAPAGITNRTFDAIVIGSMSRDPIRAQLVSLGLRPDRILAPSVTYSVDRIRHELTAWLADTMAVPS